LYTFNVYDLGLANIGYNIVKQPRQLTAKDRKAVEQHPILGTELLESIEHAPSVRDAVLHHHENYDGTGYPNKLAGDEIPLLARILRVADSFRALISHRPYQKKYTVGEALDILKHRSGSFFDPKIVSVFTDIVVKKTEDFEVEPSSTQTKEAVSSLISGENPLDSRGGN
jgi:HD-GYP domain-containing protein (c-di-GMP phosphodiesterase class II)